jgi:hypothetical protein
MTTERRGLFVMKTSEDGTKCAAECPFLDRSRRYRPCCSNAAFNVGKWHSRVVGRVRLPACIAAESAAREAEIEARIDGFEQGFSIPEHLDDEGCAALDALRAELAAIRGES